MCLVSQTTPGEERDARHTSHQCLDMKNISARFSGWTWPEFLYISLQQDVTERFHSLFESHYSIWNQSEGFVLTLKAARVNLARVSVSAHCWWILFLYTFSQRTETLDELEVKVKVLVMFFTDGVEALECKCLLIGWTDKLIKSNRVSRPHHHHIWTDNTIARTRNKINYLKCSEDVCITLLMWAELHNQIKLLMDQSGNQNNFPIFQF